MTERENHGGKEEGVTGAAVNHPEMDGKQSASHRGRERFRRLTWTAASSVLLRSITFSASFIQIPLTVRYLGQERYGYWVAMSSIVTLLAFADCGVGFGLMTSVATALGLDEQDRIRRMVSNTFFVLLGIAASLLSVFAIVYPFISWQIVFKSSSAATADECARAVFIMVATFLLTLPFTTVQRVQFAYQEGYKSQIWQVGGVLLSLLGILIVIFFHGSLPALATGFTLGPLLAMAGNWCYYFFRVRPELLPKWSHWQGAIAKVVLLEGSFFLILQVAGSIVFSTDNLILIQYFGPNEVTHYNLVAKLFQIGPALAAVWFAPLWPAYAESIARKDLDWARRTLRSTTILSVLGCGAICLFLSLTISPLVRLWANTIVHPSISLLSAFTCSALLVVSTSSIASYLNGSGFIREQAGIVIVHSLLSLGLALWLPKYWGSAGVCWAIVIAYLAVIVPAYSYIVPYLFRRQKRGNAAGEAFS